METVIFIGLQASGKSTFYKEYFFNTHVRVSLDLLKTRNREKKQIDFCIETKQRFVIDNTNPTKDERSRYIELLKKNDFKITGYYFESKIKDSLSRNKMRNESQIVPDKGILGTYNRLELPAYDEGFDLLYYVTIVNNNFDIKEWKNEV